VHGVSGREGFGALQRTERVYSHASDSPRAARARRALKILRDGRAGEGFGVSNDAQKRIALLTVRAVEIYELFGRASRACYTAL
jgi:hypothetical protein